MGVLNIDQFNFSTMKKNTPLSQVSSEALRFDRTLTFLKATLPPPARILDLGADNNFARIMRDHGYEVLNTDGDLDDHPEVVHNVDVDAVTAFEILEHLVGPINVLRQITAPRLIATIPLRLWFATAYNNPNDPWDRHFHEFEPWQFDWLLDKSGWDVRQSEKWNSPIRRLGIRPFLRLITPRYYAVDARRKIP